ncbi:MarR family transcriptional regulator [uncultured Pelagimonas sp.]|uniref:MarR family winged helix-turn-helix transcriptional regulator n=1 Tax=uncultured Pelagimonas sp. TaxID=1618102 RepID=UPI0026234F3B|nr:MarR family transcriptional regulator [uncultured Pelagimonas sp.]
MTIAASKAQLPIGSLLHHLARRFETETSAALCDIDLPLREFSTLIRLAVEPGQSQKECAAQLGFDVSTFGRMVDRMAAHGLIERRDMPGDRRSKALFLLPKGETRLQQGQTLVLEVENQILAAISNTQRAALRLCLERTLGS